MKRLLTSLMILSVLLVSLFKPTFLAVASGRTGFYTGGINLIHCEGQWACRHEIGHLIDNSMGDVSKTDDFSLAIKTYLFYKLNPNKPDVIVDTILSTSGIFNYDADFKPFHMEAFSSPQQELYANIYAAVNGDISKLDPMLRQFYDDGRNYKPVFDELMRTGYHVGKGELNANQ